MRAARELLKDLEYQVLSGSIDVNVNELVYNTKKVTKESMFVCIKGAAFDSHDAAADAAKSGAIVIVAERPVEVPEGICVVLVKDTRYADFGGVLRLSGKKAEGDRNHRNEGKDHDDIHDPFHSGACGNPHGPDWND